jgi:hypothetical protein
MASRQHTVRDVAGKPGRRGGVLFLFFTAALLLLLQLPAPTLGERTFDANKNYTLSQREYCHSCLNVAEHFLTQLNAVVMNPQPTHQFNPYDILARVCVEGNFMSYTEERRVGCMKVVNEHAAAFVADLEEHVYRDHPVSYTFILNYKKRCVAKMPGVCTPAQFQSHTMLKYDADVDVVEDDGGALDVEIRQRRRRGTATSRTYVVHCNQLL